MRKLQRKVDRLDKRVQKLRRDVDDALTPEDIEAIEEAERDYHSGKTVRIA